MCCCVCPLTVASAEGEGGGDGEDMLSPDEPKYLQELVSMGFDANLSRLVLENSSTTTPLHELVATLSDMGAGAASPAEGRGGGDRYG